MAIKYLTPGSDTYQDDNMGNRIYAGDGHDYIYGNGGDDTILGESGDDYLYGGAGNDYLDSGRVDTTGWSWVYGGSGNDRIISEGYYWAYAEGGDGDDTISGGSIQDDPSFHGGNGNDRINIYYGDYFLVTGDAGNDIIDTRDVESPVRHQELRGGTGNDLIYAGPVAEGHTSWVYGGDGNDRLYGNSAADKVWGGAGADGVWGEGGTDLFFFSAGDVGVGTGKRDTIWDFQQDDLIDLKEIDANVGKSGDQAFSWIGTKGFSAPGQLRYFTDSAGDTIVQGSKDADRLPELEIRLADLDVAPSAGDFIL